MCCNFKFLLSWLITNKKKINNNKINKYFSSSIFSSSCLISNIFAKFFSTQQSIAKNEGIMETDKDPRKKMEVFNSVLSKLYEYLNNDTLDNKTKQNKIEKFGFNQFEEWNTKKENTSVLKIDLNMINPKLKEIIVKSKQELDLYLQGLKFTINDKMKDILQKNSNKGLLKNDVNFYILSKKGKLTEEEKIEKKKNTK